MAYSKIFWYCFFILFSFCKNKPDIDFSGDAAFFELTDKILRNPEEDSLYFLRAEWYYHQNKFEEAITDLRFAIKLDSFQFRYHHLLADALLDHNQSFEALSRMEAAARLFPARMPTLLKLAEFQNILKQNDESIKTCLRILAIDPLNAEAYLMAGINYRDLKDTANAILSLQKATTYDDRLTDGWLLLAELNSVHNHTYAVQCLANAYKIDSNSTSILHSMADFYQDRNPYESIKLYEKIISLDPTYMDAINNAGILYFTVDSFTKALEHFTILCDKDPANSLYYYRRGTVKEAMNDKLGAKADYQIAVRLDPKNKEFMEALNKLN